MAKPEKLPLSPMLFQYLVGLYAFEQGSAAHYDVVLGDMVMDEASGTLRDVDVTVTPRDGVARRFVGYEVKHWKRKLDQSHVEALAMKLKDMPVITEPAIVCSSGYTKAAIKKAEHHGIDLYVIKEWTTPVEEQFPDLAPMKGPPSDCFKGDQFYLTWPEHSIHLHVAGPYFDIPLNTPLFDANGNPHPSQRDYGTFADSMLTASTGYLYFTRPMLEYIEPLEKQIRSDGVMPTLGDEPRWPFAHTINVSDAEVYIRTPAGELNHVGAVTIQGKLSWEYSPMLYLAMEKVPTGEMFASALVGVSPIPGQMFAMLIPKEGRVLRTRSIRLTHDQLNIIKQLEIAASEGD